MISRDYGPELMVVWLFSVQRCLIQLEQGSWSGAGSGGRGHRKPLVVNCSETRALAAWLGSGLLPLTVVDPRVEEMN